VAVPAALVARAVALAVGLALVFAVALVAALAAAALVMQHASVFALWRLPFEPRTCCRTTGGRSFSLYVFVRGRAELR
jgi:hypothetical protein